MPAPAEAKVLETGAATIAYEEHGAPAAPPLLLLHGLTGARQAWLPLLDGLARSWHAYVSDLRGHGASRSVEERYAVADYAGDLVPLLESIGTPAVVAGHSLGALVGIVLAAERPDLVRALVLVDPPLFSRVSVSLHPASYDRFVWLRDALTAPDGGEAIRARTREMLGPEAPEALVRGMADRLCAVRPGTVSAAIDDTLWAGVDLEAALDRIACPTLLLHGDWAHGAVVRDEDVDFFTRHVPSAVVSGIPAAGHQIPTEYPDRVIRHVDAFLTTHR